MTDHLIGSLFGLPDSRLVYVIGPPEEPLHRMAAATFPTGQFGSLVHRQEMPGDRQLVVAVSVDSIQPALTAACEVLSAKYGDSLVAAGLIEPEDPPALAWLLGLLNASRRGLFGLTVEESRYMPSADLFTTTDPAGQPMPVCEAEIYTLPAIGIASLAMASHLEGQTRRQPQSAAEPSEIPPPDPTPSKQKSKKPASGKPSKADKWLSRLEQRTLLEAKEAYKRQTDSVVESIADERFVRAYLADSLYSKAAAELSSMIAELPTSREDQPPQNLQIRADNSEIYRSWEKHRRSAAAGPASQKASAAIAEGLRPVGTVKPRLPVELTAEQLIAKESGRNAGRL